ncbi:bifunctional diaminohydroxyphosphoribosylaminopyrimidine deaminase/5-amino-6-(5-phosphoribosylamino)uracil reductase RibD [bacterium]|nr:bifunctional diaminohydroxyphosphoribosylaminopyrimidine deaminase/5-amino-6-(5-phosphoribosylamino)uracil reductase RibD [bacterium]
MRPLLPSGFGLGGHLQTSLQGLRSISNPLCNIPGLQAGEPAEFMLRAIILSMQSVGHTIPNPAVGCLLTRPDGTLVAAGATEVYGGRHAERVAFDALMAMHQSSQGLDAYVTLEPCSHHGRQPPCCELFSDSKIENLYVAVLDPNPLVNGKGLKFVQNEARKVQVGVAQNAATAWHLPFLVQQKLGRPLIAGKWAQTLDGALADANGTSQWITGPAARAHGHWLRLKYDVTAVGLNTLLADQPSLTARDCWRPNMRQPNVLILDLVSESAADDTRLQSGLRKVSDSSNDRKIGLVCPQSHVATLQGKLPPEIQLLGLPSHSRELSLAKQLNSFWTGPEINQWLGRAPQSIFIEGGAQLLSHLVAADLLDVLHIFLAPMILGGQARRVNATQLSSPELSMASHFDIISMFPLGNDMLLELAPARIVNAFFAQG